MALQSSLYVPFVQARFRLADLLLSPGGLRCSHQQLRTGRGMLANAARNHVNGRRSRHQSAGSRRTLALETLSAKHRSALRRLEWHRRLDTARRAFGTRLSARQTSRSRPCTSLQADTDSLRLARLTPFRVVLELFVEEKKLFPGGEDELTTTI
jgi:hypothetical protein